MFQIGYGKIQKQHAGPSIAEPFPSDNEEILTQQTPKEVAQPIVQQADDPKRIFRSFDMSEARDSSWVKAQNAKCDAWNTKARFSGPWLFINTTKRVQVDYYPIDGRVEVVFKKVPFAGGLNQSPSELKLSIEEWESFKAKFERFRLFIQAVEGKSSVQEAMDGSRPPIEWEVSGNFTKCKGLLTGDLTFVLKWSGEDRTCTVDIRRRVQVKVPGAGLCWKNLDEGVCLSARAFDYLTGCLGKKIDNGIRMWSSFSKASGHLAQSCLFSYEPLVMTNPDFNWTVEQFDLPKPVEDEEILSEADDYQERHFQANFGF